MNERKSDINTDVRAVAAETFAALAAPIPHTERVTILERIDAQHPFLNAEIYAGALAHFSSMVDAIRKNFPEVEAGIDGCRLQAVLGEIERSLKESK
ncbi:hypothetical protein ACFVAJ_11230 [Agromyces sp. NPDC057679]|uniref:hypothetical protein n=1 Tax=Agromyces sp. NPDC057679 TaxID=3346207 RepID=UPI0036723F41